MKIKIKLSIMMIAIVVIVAGGVAIVQLMQSKSMIMDVSRQKTMYLARQYAKQWDGQLLNYTNILQTLSNIFNAYEDIPVAERRQRFEDILVGVFGDTPDFLRLATTWKPNAIDGNDAKNIGRLGSTPTGQFTFTLSRETGEIKASAGSNTQSTMDWITGPNAKLVGISDPAPLKNQGKDTYAVRIVCPIINKRLNESVGAVIAS